MKFEEIEKIVFDRLPWPEHQTLEDMYCFEMLDLLFQRFNNGTISKHDASLRKAKIKVYYELSKRNHDTYREVMQEYQDNIKRADTLRSDIIKGARKGTDSGELFRMASECIGRMTGDKKFEEIVRNG